MRYTYLLVDRKILNKNCDSLTNFEQKGYHEAFRIFVGCLGTHTHGNREKITSLSGGHEVHGIFSPTGENVTTTVMGMAKERGG